MFQMQTYENGGGLFNGYFNMATLYLYELVIIVAPSFGGIIEQKCGNTNCKPIYAH